MKRVFSIGLVSVILSFLSGCAHHYQSTKYPHANLAQEKWTPLVETTAEHWKAGASHWFLTGETAEKKSHYKDVNYKDVPPSLKAMSTMTVDVSQFTKLSVDGPFQVQLYSSDQKNSVHIFGPNAGVRTVIVDTKGDLLCVKADPAAKNIHDMQNVVIRIGVKNLKHFVNLGQGRIEARQLHSSGMTLINKGSGNLYLEGPLEFKRIEHYGSGCLNIFSAKSHCLDLCTKGSGKVNIAGRFALRSIKHEGSAEINLIGVDGGATTIDAAGENKIGMYGHLDLRALNAGNTVCVYGYTVNTPHLRVNAAGRTCIGLAGYAEDLHLNAGSNAYIEAHDLASMQASVRTTQTGHVNVRGGKRLFVSAVDNSSVYYFGKPGSLNKFVSGNAVVLPIYDGHNIKMQQVTWKDQPVKKKAYKKRHKKVRKHQGHKKHSII